MPRPRYPSDEARSLERRAAAGVRIAFSIRNPDPGRPGHARVFEDPEMRGIWLGLIVVAGQAFAGRTNDVVTLSRADLLWITGEPRHDRATAKLRSVCGQMGYEIGTDLAATCPPAGSDVTAGRQRRGSGVTVHVKNLSQNQGWSPPSKRSTPPETPPSEIESDSEIDSESDLPPKPPTGGLASEGQNRSPRRRLLERVRSAGIEKVAEPRGVEALEHCGDLTPAELRYVARSREPVSVVIDRLLAERPNRLRPAAAAPASEPDPRERAEAIGDQLAARLGSSP